MNKSGFINTFLHQTLVIIFGILLHIPSVFSQENQDSTSQPPKQIENSLLSHDQQTEVDQEIVDSVKKRKLPVPKKSVIYSMILPGAGQVYNRRIWKVPIIYAGLGTGIYFIVDNRKNYFEFRDAFIARKSPNQMDQYEGIYSDEGLKAIRDIYRKRMEQSYFGTLFVYLLNGIEAYVDAHLQNFDIGEDLSLQIIPDWDLNPIGPQVGLALHIYF